MVVSLVNSHQFGKKIKNIFTKFLHIILGALLIIPFISFAVVVQLPIYFYRLLVTKLFAPCFRPKIGKAVTINAQFQAAEFLEKYNNQTSKYVIITNIVLKGKLPLKEFRELVLTRWIHALGEDGKARYPEFHQYIEIWMGFMFWKEVETFDINDHVFHHELNKECTAKQSDAFVTSLQEKLLNEPFEPHRSPWEVHLIENCKTAETQDEECTAMVFRFHHAMADGYALIYAVVEGLLNGSVADASIKIPEKPMSKKSIYKNKIFGMALLPFVFLQNVGYLFSLVWDRQLLWRRRRNSIFDVEAGKPRPEKVICARSPAISVQKLKVIKNKFGVSLSSVLLSSLSASLSKSFHASSSGVQRNSVRISMMLPTIGHENKLRNHTFGTIFEGDTRADVKSLERLKETERRLYLSRNSFLPNLLFNVVKLISGSLIPFASLINTAKSVPVCTSNFRGPEKMLSLENRPGLSLDATCGAFSDIMILLVSYNGQLRFNISTRDSVISRYNLEQVVQQFCEEVDCLYGQAIQKPLYV